jgi:hypothetical protein
MNTIPRNARGNLTLPRTPQGEALRRRTYRARDNDPTPFDWLQHAEQMLAENDARRNGVRPLLSFFHPEK